MILSIDFEWAVDEAGYDWVPGGPAEAGEENSPFGEFMSVLEGSPIRLDRIVRRGGKLRTYRPFERVDGLCRVFAGAAVDPKGLMNFVHRFGPMTEDGNHDGEDALIGLGHAETMAGWLRQYSQNRRECFSQLACPGLGWSRLDVALWVNPATGKPQYRFRPPALVNALWFEVAQIMTSDAQLRECAHCGRWFEVGPGTGRRADAKFCHDEHRIAFNSLKRSKGE
jgi:hypothetical protein